MKLQRYEQTRVADANRSQRANMYGARQIGNVFQTVADTSAASIGNAVMGITDAVVDLQLQAQKKIDDSAARKAEMNADMELKMFQPSLDEDKAQRQIKDIMRRIEAHDNSLEGRSVDIDAQFKTNREFYKAKLEKMQIYGRMKIADQQETAEFKTNMESSIELGETDKAIGYAQALRDKGIVVPYNDKQITSKSLASAEINSLDGLTALQIKARLEWLQDGKHLSPSGESREYNDKNESLLIKGMHKDDMEVVKAEMKKRHTELQIIAQDRLFDRIGRGELVEEKELEDMARNGEISREVVRSISKYRLDKTIKKDEKTIFEIEWALMDEDQWSTNPVKRDEQYKKMRESILTLNASYSKLGTLAQKVKSSYEKAKKGTVSPDEEKRKQVLKFGKDMIGSLYKQSKAFEIKDPWFSFDPDPDGYYAEIRSLNAITDFSQYVEKENPSLEEAMEWLRIHSAKWREAISINEVKRNFISNPMNGERAE